MTFLGMSRATGILFTFFELFFSTYSIQLTFQPCLMSTTMSITKTSMVSHVNELFFVSWEIKNWVDPVQDSQFLKGVL